MKKRYKKDIGIDIEEKARFNNISDKFIRRILTKNEINEFNKIKNINKKISYLSSRWACKEAIFKINNNVNISDIEILNDFNGRPFCSNYNNIKLSISHTDKLVIAIALLID